MKRAGFIALSFVTLSVLTIPVLSAQTVIYGLKGGFNRTSIYDNPKVQDFKVGPRPGFHVGGFVQIPLNDTWALQPEFMYSKEGAKYQNLGKSDLNYVKVPFLIQYLFGPGFRIETGPQLGLLTSAKDEDLNNKETFKTDTQDANAEWAFGLGYLINANWGVHARFNLGLSNIYLEDSNPEKSARTRAGQLGVFYQFKQK